jgi:acyl carrier protein|tara:strand:- start:422 stop:703 length:282 start_codon:yes stop_codon:yes gene_type:complete
MSENIKKEIFKKIKIASENKTLKVNENTQLIGNQAVLDSNSLVSLCVDLEDYAMKLNFEFDWSSDKAMSKSFSIFRTAKSLTKEFIKQKNKSK